MADKLVIEAYTKADYSDTKVREFKVMFNPDSYSKKFEAEYEAAQPQGSSSSTQKFKRIKPKEITLDFMLDGTGAALELDTATVEEKVEEFRKTCIDLVSEEHRPYFLYLVWGDLFLYCILKSADVKYTLFKPNGEALRAKITATFAENEADAMRDRREAKSSPDLTHVRIVQQGETLPLMCYRIYGNSDWYQEIARVNNLKNFRKLEPGTQLIFPPIDKTASQIK